MKKKAIFLCFSVFISSGVNFSLYAADNDEQKGMGISSPGRTRHTQHHMRLNISTLNLEEYYGDKQKITAEEVSEFIFFNLHMSDSSRVGDKVTLKNDGRYVLKSHLNLACKVSNPAEQPIEVVTSEKKILSKGLKCISTTFSMGNVRDSIHTLTLEIEDRFCSIQSGTGMRTVYIIPEDTPHAAPLRTEKKDKEVVREKLENEEEQETPTVTSPRFLRQKLRSFTSSLPSFKKAAEEESPEVERKRRGRALSSSSSSQSHSQVQKSGGEGRRKSFWRKSPSLEKRALVIQRKGTETERPPSPTIRTNNKKGQSKKDNLKRAASCPDIRVIPKGRVRKYIDEIERGEYPNKES